MRRLVPFVVASSLLLAACGGSEKVQNATRQFDLSVIGKGIGTVSSDPKGVLCGSQCTAAFAEHTNVKLTASPGELVRWEGACQGINSPSCEVHVDASKAVGVTFLTPISVNVVGSGTVSSAPAGVFCANGCPASAPSCANSCTGGVDPLVDTTLTVTPDPGFVFFGWSGGCAGTGACVIPPGEAANVTATFKPQGITVTPTNHNLVVNVIGSGVGSVISSPGGISCPSSCNMTVPNNTSVVLTAGPFAGNSFIGWSGACSGNATTCTVTMDAARSVTARFNANPTCGWAKKFGGTFYDRATAVDVDPNTGRILLSGTVYGSVNFGGGALSVPASSTNMFVAIFDGSGNHLNSFAKGASGSVTLGESAAWLPDSRIAVAGAWSGNVNLGDGVRDENVTTGGLFRGFLATYDAAGTNGFVRPLGATTAMNDGFCGLSVDPRTGDITVVGEFAEPESFGGPTLYTPADYDAYIAQYSSTGTFRWARKAGGAYYDHGLTVASRADGKVAYGGSFHGGIDFGNGAYPSNTTDSAFVAQYGADGGYLSDKVFSPQADGGYNGTRAVTYAPNGDLVVAGAITTQTDMGGQLLTSAGSSDAFIARYTPAGSLFWANRLGGPAWDEAYAVAVDSTGNVYVAGAFTGTVTFGTATKTAVGESDIFLVKYNASGALQSVRTWGGSGFDVPYALSIDSLGNVIMAAAFENAITVNGVSLSSAGYSDMFFACFTP